MTIIIISSVYSNYATDSHAVTNSSYADRANDRRKGQREIDSRHLDRVENNIKEHLFIHTNLDAKFKRTKFTLIVTFDHISQVDMVRLSHSVKIPKELRLEIK